MVTPPGSTSEGIIARTVHILGRLGHCGRPVTLSELSRATAIPKSSVHRILSALVVAEAVARDGERYRIGPGFADVIRQRGGHTPLRRAVMPYLVDLHRRTGQIVGLAVLDGDDVVLLDTVHAPHHQAILQMLPDRAVAELTAAGQILLAMRADDGRGSDEQDRIRRDGIAVRCDDHRTTLAAAIVGRRRHAVAAVTVDGRASDIGVDRQGAMLRQAAYAASVAVCRLAADR